MRSRFVEIGLALTLLGCGSAEAATEGGPLNAAAAPPAAEAASELATATVERSDGDVRCLRRGAGSWEAAGASASLFEADQLQTMNDATASVRMLASGVVLQLAPSSVLMIPEQRAQARRMRHVSGHLVARLEPNADAGRLEVELPPGDLVLESDSTAVESLVEVDHGEATVAMVHGHGLIERRSGEALAVEESRYVHLAPDGEVIDEGANLAAPVELLEPSAEAVTTRGQVHFTWSPVEGATRYRLYLRWGERLVELEADAPEARAAVRAGRLEWWVRAEDVRGLGHPSESDEVTIVLDRTPPALTVTSPAQNAVANGPTVRVAGRAEAGARVEVDHRQVELREDGSFGASVQVPPGLANVVVRAVDEAGNRRTVTRQVVRR